MNEITSKNESILNRHKGNCIIKPQKISRKSVDKIQEGFNAIMKWNWLDIEVRFNFRERKNHFEDLEKVYEVKSYDEILWQLRNERFLRITKVSRDKFQLKCWAF